MESINKTLEYIMITMLKTLIKKSMILKKLHPSWI